MLPGDRFKRETGVSNTEPYSSVHQIAYIIFISNTIIFYIFYSMLLLVSDNINREIKISTWYLYQIDILVTLNHLGLIRKRFMIFMFKKKASLLSKQIIE